MKVLAIDIGSSSVKAAVFDGRQFSTPVRVAFPTVFDGARVEISPGVLLTALFRAVREGGARAGKGAAGGVEAVAFCTFSPGVVVMKENGAARTAIVTHADRRSTGMAEELVRRHGKGFWLRHAGNLPYPGSIGASTLGYFRKHVSGIFAGKYRVGQASTLIGHALTGEFVIDPSQAVFLGLLDIETGGWSAGLCGAVKVREESLPMVRKADAVLGRLTKSAARRLGLTAGIPVVGGCVDTSAAILQTPMVAGQLTHSAGSTDVLAMCLEKPRPREGILTRPVGVGDRLAERWLAVRTIASSGSALAWMQKAMFRELKDEAWKKLVDATCAEAAKSVRKDWRGWVGVECVPTFAGERAAVRQPEGGSFSRLHLSTTREEVLAALVRGLVEASGENYRLLQKMHATAKVVYAMGGASALGAAMHAGWAGSAGNTHTFRSLKSDNLAGLVLLAKAALGGKR